MKPKISIIIPTMNRSNVLERCLKNLREQTFKNFEVIVVDDGSTDNTKKLVKKFKGLELKYVYQEHKQQGAARNRGVKIARGKYVAFIGDDIFVKKNWLAEHLDFLKKGNSAVLGLTLWHPELEINEFMRYLAPRGPQFNYAAIKDRKNTGWKFFWTSNISLEKKWLENEKFDENFRGWGYEDLELGYRLEKNGLKIAFNPRARAFHYHQYDDPSSFLKNWENAAKNAKYIVSKHPELRNLIDENVLNSKHRLLLGFYNTLPFIKNIGEMKRIYWKLKRREHFTRGLKNG